MNVTIRRKNERGAILVLTAMMVISLLTFTAMAVDVGMRNDLLARDQHAIDAATIAAIHRVNRYAYDGESLQSRMHAATEVAKEVVWQNTGLSKNLWASCVDDGHYAGIDPLEEGTCISFDTAAAGTTLARVILPDHAMDAIFGRAANVDEYQLAAAANADGNSCDTLINPGCDAEPTSTTSTSTPQSSTTEFTWPNYCNNQIDELNLVLNYGWVQCEQYWPDYDRTSRLAELCTPGNVFTYFLNGHAMTIGPGQQMTITEEYSYLYWWDGGGCSQVPGLAGARSSWLPNYCAGISITVYHTNYAVYLACETYHPGWETWNQYWSTSTTSSTSSTSTTSQVTTTLPVSTTVNIDIS